LTHLDDVGLVKDPDFAVVAVSRDVLVADLEQDSVAQNLEREKT
jgi:hypothetical protein